MELIVFVLILWIARDDNVAVRQPLSIIEVLDYQAREKLNMKPEEVFQ